MYTNAEKLSAVLVKWAQPAIQGLLSGRLSSLPMVANIECKIKSTGWVSPMWSLASELSPIMDNLSANMITPFLTNYISRMPDNSIPYMAHELVDGAIKNGGLSLFEGKVEFEKDDLIELKELLKYNLPIEVNGKSYEVMMESPVKEEPIKNEKP